VLNKRTVQIHDIGEVSLEKSQRARNINISVRSSKEVRVAVPIGTPFLVAENFANKKKDWILKKISEISSKQRLSLKVGEDHSKKERKISERVDQLAKKFDFQYNSVTFKDMRSRWGSCSYENNICLNKKLSLLPDRLRDCIILHELLHTKIKNHGSSFWCEFDRMVPNAKRLHREINKKYII